MQTRLATVVPLSLEGCTIMKRHIQAAGQSTGVGLPCERIRYSCHRSLPQFRAELMCGMTSPGFSVRAAVGLDLEL